MATTDAERHITQLVLSPPAGLWDCSRPYPNVHNTRLIPCETDARCVYCLAARKLGRTLCDNVSTHLTQGSSGNPCTRCPAEKARVRAEHGDDVVGMNTALRKAREPAPERASFLDRTRFVYFNEPGIDCFMRCRGHLVTLTLLVYDATSSHVFESGPAGSGGSCA